MNPVSAQSTFLELSTMNGGNIIINCIADKGCNGNTFSMKGASIVSIHCIADYACEFSNIFTKDSSLIMECYGSYSCYYTNIAVVNVTSSVLHITEESGFDNGFLSSHGASNNLQNNCQLRCFIRYDI
eukprot:744415_1